MKWKGDSHLNLNDGEGELWICDCSFEHLVQKKHSERRLRQRTDGQPDPLTGCLGGWMKWPVGGWGAGHWAAGGRLEKVGEVKAGRVHPSSPIGQTARRVLCSFEALKWTEFHHGHGDCSMSFVRNFGEMVLKMERLARGGNAGVFVFRGALRVLSHWSWGYTWAGDEAAAN